MRDRAWFVLCFVGLMVVNLNLACVSFSEEPDEIDTTPGRSPASLREYPDCSPENVPGTMCRCRVLDLRPTQFAVGMRAVQEKEDKLTKKAKKVDKYLSEHPEPVIIGPEGRFYIIDHHHLARALYNQEIESTYCDIRENKATLDIDSFWAMMKEKAWVYPYDENGNGPHNPMTLPTSVVDLKDDPYRSLAWGVREAEGYEKTPIPFAEFKWAEYFRPRIDRRLIIKDFDQAVLDGVELAHTPEAAKLPGYRGK